MWYMGTKLEMTVIIRSYNSIQLLRRIPIRFQWRFGMCLWLVSLQKKNGAVRLFSSTFACMPFIYPLHVFVSIITRIIDYNHIVRWEGCAGVVEPYRKFPLCFRVVDLSRPFFIRVALFGVKFILFRLKESWKFTIDCII